VGSGKVLNVVTVISSDGAGEEAIKLAVMPDFGILKHLFLPKTISAHSNLSSYSGISDTFVLYNYTQSILILINCIAGNPKIFTYNGKNAEEFLLTLCTRYTVYQISGFSRRTSLNRLGIEFN